MSISLLSQSPLTTLQDLGRIGYRQFGVNPNGVMDRQSARLINLLLGNDSNEAVLEMHFPAPQLRFDSDAMIVLGGADFSAHLDDVPVGNWQVIPVKKASVLRFAQRRLGTRLYLSVKGGFDSEPWLGSTSVSQMAGIGHPLKKGESVGFRIAVQPEWHGMLSSRMIPPYSNTPMIRVIKACDFDSLDAVSQLKFPQSKFILTQESNRMGYRLEGTALTLDNTSERISTAVNFGTVQLLPSGQLIVLMADHQTTGGYPQIANVISMDLPLLAQLSPGDSVTFQVISISAAESLIMQFERALMLLKTGAALTHQGRNASRIADNAI